MTDSSYTDSDSRRGGKETHLVFALTAPHDARLQKRPLRHALHAATELRDNYHVKMSKSLEEDEDIISVGFEYVTGLGGAEVHRESKQSKPTEAGSKP